MQNKLEQTLLQDELWQVKVKLSLFLIKRHSMKQMGEWK